MATFYLDIDDEITSAAARIRGTDDLRIALVLPAGSRIATSRINFRLLAREAQARSRRLAIVAPEGTARALAASAGLPVFATVVEYEDALAGERAAAAAGVPAGAMGGAAAGVSAAPPVGPPLEPGVSPGAPAGATPTAVPPAAMPGIAVPPDQGRRLEPEGATGRPQAGTAAAWAGAPEALRPVGPSTGLGAGAPPRRAAPGRRRPLLVASVGILALAAVAAGVGAYVFLPTARVVVTPATRAIGPVGLMVEVDPAATEPDPGAGTVPAATIEFPVAVEGSFKATGKRVEEKKATGTVRWSNCDPTAAYTIPRGTLVRTAAGVAFSTREALFLPVAVITGIPPHVELSCPWRDVDVIAVKPGPTGNVDAGTITRVPGSYNEKVVGVTNPAATSGGSHEEFPRVTQEDVDAALATLTGLLDGQLAATAASPPGVPPGAAVVPGTAERGDATPTPDPATLVDQEVKEFGLALAATGTVLAVTPADVRSVAAAVLGANVPAGYRLDPSSVAIEVGVPVVEDGAVSVPASGGASVTRIVDEDEVRALVAGKTPAEAAALLEPFGTAEISVWPDWVPTITSIGGRLTVEIVAGRASPAPSDGSGASGRAAPSEAPAP